MNKTIRPFAALCLLAGLSFAPKSVMAAAAQPEAAVDAEMSIQENPRIRKGLLAGVAAGVALEAAVVLLLSSAPLVVRKDGKRFEI